MALFPDIRKAKALFGDAAEIYGSIINEIEPFLVRDCYKFEPLDQFEQRSAERTVSEINRVYWIEMLQRAHMASVAAIARTCRWVDVAVREYDAANIFGWSSAARSIIEAAGDAGEGLAAVPRTLADHKLMIQGCLSGSSTTLHTSAELEDLLIHFSHARKIAKGEIAPDSHRAKSSAAYVDFVTRMNVGDVRPLYAKLCEIVHPASTSVALFFSGAGDTLTVDLKSEVDFLEKSAKASRQTLGACLMASFNPALLTLRVLHSFDHFTRITPLKKVNFSAIPAWPPIEKLLK
ncbi:hypothetical protein LJR245_007497 [Rhizobium leguminosarum]|uniref:hypothetical protein n=1 Tax=Rhizobium leguminosarum TaxID=384 RepID=UPI003ECF28C1